MKTGDGKNVCCTVFELEVNEGTINGPSPYSIRGKTKLVRDGNGRRDDMAREVVISYCPFCGSGLSVCNL